MSSAIRARPWVVALVAVAGSISAGCEGAEEKCARLQAEAAKAWNAYAAVLEKQSAEALRANASAKTKAEAIEARLLADARRQADGLYESKSSAWWRAVDAAQQTLCTKDAECLELKAEIRATEDKRKELGTRLTAVRAAAAAATSAAADVKSAPEAQSAAQAVQDDFDRPEIKPARAAGGAAREACEGVGG